MAAPRTQNRIIRWIDHRLPVFSYLDHELNEYPTPRNLSYWWNFGSRGAREQALRDDCSLLLRQPAATPLGPDHLDARRASTRMRAHMSAR